MSENNPTKENMNKHYELYKEKVEELETYFRKEKLVIGHESGSKGSLVFINDQLERPRLRNRLVKQTFIDIADREIERLGGKKKYRQPETASESVCDYCGFSKDHRECECNYNYAIKNQISYWKEAKELIENDA